MKDEVDSFSLYCYDHIVLFLVKSYFEKGCLQKPETFTGQGVLSIFSVRRDNLAY